MRAPEKIRIDVDRREANALYSALSTALVEAHAKAEPWAHDAEDLLRYLQRRMRERHFL